MILKFFFITLKKQPQSIQPINATKQNKSPRKKAQEDINMCGLPRPCIVTVQTPEEEFKIEISLNPFITKYDAECKIYHAIKKQKGIIVDQINIKIGETEWSAYPTSHERYEALAKQLTRSGGIKFALNTVVTLK